MDCPWIINGLLSMDCLWLNKYACKIIGNSWETMRTLLLHLLFMFWDMRIVNIRRRFGQKLCRTSLLHFGLVTFRLGYERDRTLFIFMISGLSDVSRTPRRHEETLTQTRKFKTASGHNMFASFEMLEIDEFENIAKDGHRQILKVLLNLC